MTVETFDNIIAKLKEDAKSLGFNFMSSIATREICYQSKTIKVVYSDKSLDSLYATCHELGHAKDANCNNDLYRTNKAYRIYTEVKAWTLGYEFVRKYSLPKLAYWIDAFGHLKTYI